MDWRLNGKNAEQNYKIIIDKGAVRMGVGEREDSIPPLLTQAPLRHRHSRPPKSFQNARGSVMCVIP